VEAIPLYIQTSGGSGQSGNNSYPDVAVVARTSCFADTFVAKVVLWERRPR